MRTEEELFWAARGGRVEPPTRILSQNLWALDCIYHDGGKTPLHFALECKNKREDVFTVFKLLVAAGSDIFQDDDYGFHPVSIVAQEALIAGRDLHSDIPRLLRVWEWLEDIFIPRVSQTILRLPGGLKKEELMEHGEGCQDILDEVNLVDDLGFTPLAWAVVRNQTEVARMLLKLGADAAAKCGMSQRTILHLATVNDSYESVPLLCGYGAGLYEPKRGGTTPAWVAIASGSLGCLKAMIAQDSDVATKSAHVTVETFPIIVAAAYGRLEVLQYLLSLGDPALHADVTDDTGNSMIYLAMCFQQPSPATHRVLAFLLENEANHLLHNVRTRETVLHGAAKCADVVMMDLLAQRGLSGLDVDARDDGGDTAWDIFNVRSGKSEDLVVAFERLIYVIKSSSVSAADLPGLVDGEDDGEEEGQFFDATEELG